MWLVSTISKLLTISKWWTRLMVNRKALEMWRIELFWVHMLIRLPCYYSIQQLFNPVHVLISTFSTVLTNWLTDRQTYKQTKLIACSCSVIIMVSGIKLTRHHIQILFLKMWGWVTTVEVVRSYYCHSNRNMYLANSSVFMSHYTLLQPEKQWSNCHWSDSSGQSTAT